MSTPPINAASGAERSSTAAGERATPRIVHWTSSVLEWIGMAAIIVMMFNVVLEVVLRTLFNSPIPGTLELVTFWYIVMISFIGMWLAQRRREHISVTLIFDRLTLRAQRIVAIAGNTLTAVLLVLFIWYGLQTAMRQAGLGEYTGATEFPIWPMRFVVPITLAAWLIVLIAQTIEVIRNPEVLRVEHDPETEVV